MDEPQPNYRREFWKSPHHAWCGFLTLGVGFLSAQPLFLIAGATAYALGLIYIPDLPLFKKWVDRRQEAAKRAAALAQVADFVQRRESLLTNLAHLRRQRYDELAGVCRDIENATADSPIAAADPATDPRLRKLDELMWTYLRLLGIEESLERFLDTERKEDLPRVLQQAQSEEQKLTAEIESLKSKGAPSLLESKQRLVESRRERIGVLNKRIERIEQAKNNLSLVISEQERLVEQIKLIRADAVAAKNAETLTARIDATVEHLDHTTKWIAELDEFKDLVGDMPATDFRIGYESRPATPPLIQTQNPTQTHHSPPPSRPRQPLRNRN